MTGSRRPARSACLAGLFVAGLAASCSVPPPESERLEKAAATRQDDPQLENPDWRIEKMAAAHGTAVIEVVARYPASALEIARAVTEPIKDGYTEVLVLLRVEADPSLVPAVTVRWTSQSGYQISQSGPP